MNDKRPAPKKYSPELKDRAVRMTLEAIEEQGGVRYGVVPRIAGQLGVGEESLRKWVLQADIDRGTKPGVTTDDKQKIAELEKQNRELRRANEILRAASAFFARELDPRLPK
jgi:transposase